MKKKKDIMQIEWDKRAIKNYEKFLNGMGMLFGHIITTKNKNNEDNLCNRNL